MKGNPAMRSPGNFKNDQSKILKMLASKLAKLQNYQPKMCDNILIYTYIYVY